MKKIILAALAVCTMQTAATAQTNSTNRPANGGGHMGNHGTGVNSGTLPPAGRDGVQRDYAPPIRTGDTLNNGAVSNDTMSNGTTTRDRMGSNTGNGAMRANDGTSTMLPGNTSTTIGGVNRAELDRMNAEGNRKVAAIKPTSTPLSKEDQKLLVQMAEGSIMQFQVSQAAVGRVQHEDVKFLAQSEVEEQSGVNAKILEIARAKGMTLNTEPTAATSQMLLRIQQTTDIPELYEYYLRQSGIDGHEKLMKTGEKVMREAKDPALKALAEATAPVIRMHMQVSRGVLEQVLARERNGNRDGATGGGQR